MNKQGLYRDMKATVDRQGCKGMSLNAGLTLEGSIFPRVGAPTAKALVPISVMTLGTKK